MRLYLVIALAAPLLGACTAKKSKDVALADGATQGMLAGEAAQELAAPLPLPSDEKDVGYVLLLTAVRRQPTDAKEVDTQPTAQAAAGDKKPTDPPKARKQANWLTQLHRGERVGILNEEGSWLQVRTSDEQTGWVRRASLLVGDTIAPATVHEPVRVFGRPDLLALVPGRQIEAGALIFTLRTKDQFTQVNDQGLSTGWILTAMLEISPDEVDVAKLLSRAAALEDKHDAAAAGLRQLAQAHYGHTRLVKEILGPPAHGEQLGPDEADSVQPEQAGGGPGPGAGAIDEHGQWQETADPGVAAPGGFDSPSSGPPQYQPQMQQEPQQAPAPAASSAR